MENPVLVEVTRGELVESRHRGAVAVLDADGCIVFSCGDIDRPIFPRSAIKALQALPLIESGAAERFGLTDEEIALACASHNGEVRHVETAASMLAKAGLDAEALECGAHWPMFDKASRALAERHLRPSALNNNCSGKHSGFLCVCCASGFEPAGYVKAGHPLQETVRICLEELTGTPHGPDNRGTDGCSIPTYAVPLRNLAHAFAKFGGGAHLPAERRKAASRILSAIAAAPYMVAGEGRFDTEVMSIFGASVMVKTGAEGVYCATFPKLGLGVAAKCDDGNTRAAQLIMATIIARFIQLSESEAQRFEPVLHPVLRNWNGIHVGGLAAAGPLRDIA